MANHGVLIGNKYLAKDNDVLVRPVVSASAIDNGYVFNLLSQSATAGQTEAWTATWPVTGSLVGLWMAYEPELPSAFAGTKQYRGFGTVQDFYNVAGQVFTAIKISVGDIYTMSIDVMSGVVSTGDYLVAADSAYQLAWSAAGVNSTTIMKRLATTYMSLPDGSIGTQHIVAYKVEVLVA